MYGLSGFWGVAQVIAPENSLLYLLTVFAFATLTTMWFWIDRRILARPHVPILFLLFFLVWPVASFVHLLATRGIRGCGYWLVHALGLFVTMYVTFFITVLLLYWMGILDENAVFVE